MRLLSLAFLTMMAFAELPMKTMGFRKALPNGFFLKHYAVPRNAVTKMNAMVFPDEHFDAFFSSDKNGSQPISPEEESESESESESWPNLEENSIPFGPNSMPVGIRFVVRKGDPNYEAFMNRFDKNNDKAPDRSENFEVIKQTDITFDDIGGYENVKSELMQSADILVNYTKYEPYNVRVPKGLILEGPPGNGKTLLAKAYSGEVNVSFIPVSGSEFQEKYVGVGSARIRELFELAEQNTPCIIFIDEIDAVGRARTSDQESSSAERDNTLNQMLVMLDGFKKSNGIFIIAATNRIDLLDPALLRPGRIDKKIYISNPDSETRAKIIDIHLTGKAFSNTIHKDQIIEMTSGMSGAEIENLINEAMLSALRENRQQIELVDLEYVLARTIAGFQANKNIFSDEMIKQIAIHELGHAVTGFLLPDHSRLSKVHLNMWSPKSPGYTIFENTDIDSNIFTRDKLFAHLVVLLGGRAAEEVIYKRSVTTGASKDFQEAYKLAQSMIMTYGMGSRNVFPYSSEKYREQIDEDINNLISDAYKLAIKIITQAHVVVVELADQLVRDQILTRESVEIKIFRKARHLLNDNFKM